VTRYELWAIRERN